MRTKNHVRVLAQDSRDRCGAGVQPFHIRPTGAASALSMGTRLAPPLPGGSLPATFGLAKGFGAPFVGAVLLFIDEPGAPEVAPLDSFARLTFSFSSATAGRVREGTVGSALAFPFSFTVNLGAAAAGTAPVLRFARFRGTFFSLSGGLSSSSEMPNSCARLLVGARTGGAVGAPGVGDSSSICSSRESNCGRSMSGLSGEFASMRILLRGLGLTGEYACIIRVAASGLAIGKGLRGRGVLGPGSEGGAGAKAGALLDIGIDAEGSGLGTLSALSEVEVGTNTGGWRSAGSGSRVSGIDGSNEGGSGLLREAAGDGGGSTKTGAAIGSCDGGRTTLDLKLGICNEEGITSVSKGGITFFGETPRPDERRETRVFLPLPPRPAAMPAAFLFAGDLRGDLGGGDCGRIASVTTGGRAAVAVGAGVGGSSASINSTCQDRFSSKNLIRSACKDDVSTQTFCP